LFAAYKQERAALNNENNASLELTHVLSHPTEYPMAYVESLLRQLEQFTLTGSPEWLRNEAVLGLALPSSKRVAHPIPSSFARLERIYRRSPDPVVKRTVINAMGSSSESQRACAFLEQIATQDSADYPDAPVTAITSLLIQGDEGKIVLKRLHENGKVRDREARRSLAILAKSEFRLPEKN
jgi:hypothetical protein